MPSDELSDLIDVLALGPPSDEGQLLRVHLSTSSQRVSDILVRNLFHFLIDIFPGPYTIVLDDSNGAEHFAFFGSNGVIEVERRIDTERAAGDVRIYDPLPAGRPTLLDRYFLYWCDERRKRRQGPDQPLL